MATVTHLYDSYSDAKQALDRLVAAGVPHDQISLVANNADNRFSQDKDRIIDRDHDGVDDRAEAAGTGAGVGATLGGAAGLLAGLGIMAIPGIGPVVAAGWLASTALGAAIGGAGGGIVGALTQAGVSETDAHVYAEGVRRGGTLLTARVPDGDRARLEPLLATSAIDISKRAEAYRSSGWNRFDDQRPHLTAEELRREAELRRTL